MPYVTQKTITETFFQRVKVTPDAPAFHYKPTYPEAGPLHAWKTVTFKEYYQECRLVSFGLMGLGLDRGDRAVILSNSRYEWSLCDMAILGAGAITVPIYASNTADDVIFIMNHSEAKIAIVEDAKQLEKILAKRLENPACLPFLKKIVAIEPRAMTLVGRYADVSNDVLTLTAVKDSGQREEAKAPTRFEDNLRSAQPDDLITICYTSGTTGVPKGAMISHDNMMSVLEDCVAAVGRFVDGEKSTILSFLPYSHILGKVESMAIFTFGWKAAFAENIDRLMTNIGEVKPTLLFAVPRIFEKAFNRMLGTVDSGPPAKRKLFYWALSVGRRYYSAIWAGKSPDVRTRAQYRLAKTLVFSKVARRFGGRLQFAICGGAPLAREIGEFFQIVGIKILEGYGLTETCAPVALNTPDDARFGVVGRPLPEVTIKIAEDGEILVKSRKVFRGYYKMPQESAEAMDGGWFHTGDIGHIDNDGFIQITDRKKDLIVTSGGKNVAPQKIENLAKSQKWISQFVVHGDRRHYLTALVNLDREAIIKYASESQILFSEYSELVKNPKIIAVAQRAVDEVNRHLASFETIRKFVIVPIEFSIETGELTPSMKVKRSFVNKRYKAELDSMYPDAQHRT